MRALSLLVALTVAAPLAGSPGGPGPAGGRRAAREIAITFDDLPLNGPPLGLPRLEAMTARLLDVVRRRAVPVVGFVNESQLYAAGETDSRIAVLKAWTDAGAELGNHTFSHLNFKGTPLAAYQDDVVRGDTVSRMLMEATGRRIRYFRHPYLQMGDTREIEESFERFLADRGYRMAPVTADTLDWVVLNAYNTARKEPSGADVERVRVDYLKLAAERLAASEGMADQLFGRPIRQVLLLHANELNADVFERLVAQMEAGGYRFITLEEALADDIYRYPESYRPTSQWLAQWAASSGLTFNPPGAPATLR